MSISCEDTPITIVFQWKRDDLIFVFGIETNEKSLAFRFNELIRALRFLLEWSSCATSSDSTFFSFINY